MTWLRPPADDVIDDLICQAMATKRASTPQEKIRELVHLVVAELQAQLNEREYNARRRSKALVAE
jgi:hypothetical protein